MGVLVVAEGKTLIFRTALFIGLGSVVATIIYLTPVPDRYPQSCSRPCHELDWPMICRVKLTLERYQTLSSACSGCPQNYSDCYRKHCITADGSRQGILAVNRQFPGPNIQVCQNDIIVVDVVNRIPGQSFGIHWRGQPQAETPHMDGVPMVTQCPIPSFTTFQYKFRASDAGTHMWQVNTGEATLGTLFGGFIVRQPDSKDIQKNLYDTDEASHVINIHSWTRQMLPPALRDAEPKSILLINGKIESDHLPAAVFPVVSETRHRFRVMFGGHTTSCQVTLSVDRHQMLAIALDGHAITPRMVTSIRLSQGERVDFILRADQPISSYHLNVDPDDGCTSLSPVRAVVRYAGAETESRVGAKEEEEDTATQRQPEFTELMTVQDLEDCVSTKQKSTICVNDLHGLLPMPKDLSGTPDNTIYLYFGYSMVSSSNITNTSFIAIEDLVRIPHTNNMTMMFPPSPLLSQSRDISHDLLCRGEDPPLHCGGGGVCECVHVLPVALGSLVEIVLVNRVREPKKGHVFHLHGHSFHLLGITAELPPAADDPETLKTLDQAGELLKRNLATPVMKDTVHVPGNGMAVIRFRANNPGYWLLDEEHSSHWNRGMSVILHVGVDSDLPDTPKDFPKCGNWIGPEFFLV